MEWLRTYQAQHFLDHPVICFISRQEYPFLFFSLFLRRLAQDYKAITYCNLQQPSESLYAQLEVSFLGLPRIYWLGSLNLLSKEQFESWRRYINTYAGPNYILYVSKDEELGSNHKVIDLKEGHITKRDFISLFSFFVRSARAADAACIDQLYAKIGSIQLDTACLLLEYLQVTGSRDQEFFDNWLKQIVVPEQSLFSVSQYFFAKDRKAFFNHWSFIKQHYVEQFWIAFFSDNVWRAAFYCKYMKEAKWNDAKTIGHRLPFSFLQKDHKNFSFQELCKAHNWLYETDYAIKNGASIDRIELFLYHFFANYFQEIAS